MSLKYLISKKKKDEQIKLLVVQLPEMSGYLNEFKATKYMFFLTKDEEELEKSKSIWDKISDVMNKMIS